jgi:hypothetical protein
MGTSRIKSWRGREFPYLPRLALGPTHHPVQWVPGLCPRVKQLGHGIDHPPPSSAAITIKVELYIHSPCAFMACSRVIFTFMLYIFGGYALICVANNVTGFSVGYYKRSNDIFP